MHGNVNSMYIYTVIFTSVSKQQTTQLSEQITGYTNILGDLPDNLPHM